jgi:ADP-heptose:LPS heptosyltransferase
MSYAFKKPIYKILIPIFDTLGSIFFFPMRLFSKSPSNPKNILIVRLDHIGDFVCTTPLLKNLKNRFPGSKITALVNSASKDLARRDPNIDKVITFSPSYLARNESSFQIDGFKRVIKDVKALGFDLGIDPRGDLISILLMWLGGVRYRIGYGITGGGFLLDKVCKYDESKHVIDRNLALLKALDIPISDRLPEVYFSEKDREEVERLLRPVPEERSDEWYRARNDEEGTGLAMTKKAVVLHPFAGAKAKEWLKDNFQKLINRLKESGYEILLVGSKDDRGAFEDVIDLRGKLSLPQLACLIKKIGLFIGLDSGPANIAAALNVPSVIICSGTNVPQLWIPNNSNVRFVYKDTDCKPCENKICPKPNHECMDGITVKEVFEKFKEMTK